MTTPDRRSDEELDRLLDGAASGEVEGSALAGFLDGVRHEAAAAAPAPSEALAAVLDEGFDPVAVGAAARGDRATPAGVAAWRQRGRTAVRLLVTKFAALGLLSKAAVAGAAVGVAASSAGAAGVLPPPTQAVFDEAVGRTTTETSNAPDDVPTADQEDTSVPTGPGLGDTSTTPPLESDVAGDATGGDGSEPGVDGRGIAEDATELDDEGQVDSAVSETPAPDAAPHNVPPDEADMDERTGPPTPIPPSAPTGSDDAAHDEIRDGEDAGVGSPTG